MKQTIIKIFIIALVSLNIASVSANYEYKIEDKIKINNFNTKIEKYLSNKKTAYYLAKKLKRKIEKILKKTEKELKEKYENKQSKYKDFKEYALTDIYWKIKIINNSVIKNRIQFYSYNYQNPEILENNYIKIIIDKDYLKNSKITLDNKTLTTTYSDWHKRKNLEFFKIKPEEKTEDYLKKIFLKEEFIWKCRVEKWFNKNNIKYRFSEFNIRAFWNYIDKEHPGWEECWERSKFIRISKNILIKSAYTQEYEGFDLNSIEIK